MNFFREITLFEIIIKILSHYYETYLNFDLTGLDKVKSQFNWRHEQIGYK